MQKTLVIGYGNTLRGDDGVGPIVASRLVNESWASGVDIVVQHQLLPEIAEQITHVALVIFVDATIHGRPGDVRCQFVEPTTGDGDVSTHQMTPEGVLTLAQLLYGRVPKAYLLTVTGRDFSHTERLTPEVETAVATAIDQIRDLVSADTTQTTTAH